MLVGLFPVGENRELVAALAGAAEVLELPLLRIDTDVPELIDGVRTAWSQLGTDDWVAVTSINAVRVLERVLSPVAPAEWRRVHWAAVGEKTAAACRAHVGQQVLVPERHDDESLATALAAHAQAASAVLLPRSEQADARLPTRLKEAGLRPLAVPAYRNVLEIGLIGEARRQINRQEPRVWLLTSGSAARALFEVYDGLGKAPPAVGVIGASTRRVAERLGMSVLFSAREPTMAALAAAWRAWSLGADIADNH